MDDQRALLDIPGFLRRAPAADPAGHPNRRAGGSTPAPRTPWVWRPKQWRRKALRAKRAALRAMRP